MLNQDKVFQTLQENGIHFFTGVPDSYLNGFCHYSYLHCKENFVIAANEGNAVGIAAGHYFASGEIPLVFLQNSGLGNAINPLVSLADDSVYGVPMILLIGWRGQGNTEPNHPQHALQGKMTPGQLELMNIPYEVLEDDEEQFSSCVLRATDWCRKHGKAYALLVPKGVMAKAEKENLPDSRHPMSRREALRIILDFLPKDTIYLATTGRMTRELYFLREERGESKKNDFLNLGAMGHLSSIALGIAMKKKDRLVVALDGDGSAIMHMGAFTMAGKAIVPNLLHVVFNNGAHESVGGQPTAGFDVDFTGIAKACGYETVGESITNEDELKNALIRLKDPARAAFIDCRIRCGMGEALPPLVFDQKEAIREFTDGLQN